MILIPLAFMKLQKAAQYQFRLAAAPSAQYTLVVDPQDGKVYHWGENDSGQRGDNSLFYPENSIPKPFSSSLLVGKVSAGVTHVLAIESTTGYAYAWGSNLSGSGQLGDGTNVNKSSPVSVLGGRSYTEIHAGYLTSHAIEGSTGNAWAWGNNIEGALGDNTATAKSSPVSVVGGRSYSRISGGSSGVAGFAIAIEGSTGNAWGWGSNVRGQLGDNTILSRSSPVSVLGGRSFSRISGTLENSDGTAIAIEGSTGNAWAWGSNLNGLLGDNTATNKSSPVSVLGGRSYTEISSSAQHGLAIEGSTGNAWAWGSQFTGATALGNNTEIAASSPVSVVGGRSFNQISAGRFFSTAYENSTGLIWGWGSNNMGQLDSGLQAAPASPVSPIFTASASRLAMGSGTNGIGYTESTSGLAYMYGTSNSGMLGDNSIAISNTPVSVVGGRSYSRISAYSTSVLAIEGSTGNAYAWGTNSSGVLGDNTILNRSSPVSVLGGRSYREISNSSNFSVAIEGSTGNAWAWGSGTAGKLGNNAIISRSSPVAVTGGRSYSKISCGNVHAVAIEGSTGRAWAWGTGTTGQLGDNTVTSKSAPVSVVGGRSYREIAGSFTFCVAIEGSTGNAWAWGNNNVGQLGDGTALNKSSPVSVLGGRSYTQIASAGTNIIAIEGSTGNAYMWGDNSVKVLGDGTNINRSSPVSVLGGRSYNLIASGGTASAAAYEASTGIIWVWGNSVIGLGTAVTSYSSPVSVGRIFI